MDERTPVEPHAKCLAAKETIASGLLVCGRSKGHERNNDRRRHMHYDPSKLIHWGEPEDHDTDCPENPGLDEEGDDG